MNNINKLLSLFLLLSFILGFIFVDTVNSTDATFSTGFEDGTVSNDYSNSWLTTKKISTPAFWVDSLSPRTGTKDFRINVTNTVTVGYWNLTNMDTMQLEYFGFYFKSPGNDGKIWISFYNKIGTLALKFYINDINPGSSAIYFYDYLGAQTTLKTSADFNTYTLLAVRFLANDSVTYQYGSTFVNSTPRTILDFVNITSIKFETQNMGSSPIFYFDDLTLISTDYYGSGTTYGDVSAYSSECIGYGSYPPSSPDGYFLMDDEYIEYEYNTPMSGTIYALDIPISLEQYNTVNFGTTGKDNYVVYLNGVDLGHPTYAIPSGSNYILRWINFAVTLTDEKPLICIASYSVTIKYGESYRWVGLAIGYEGYIKTHDSFASATDTIFNGNSAPFGMSFCMYYISTPISSPYTTDFIYLYQNQSSFEQYDSIALSIGLKQYIPNTYLKFYEKVGVNWVLYQNDYMNSTKQLYGSFAFTDSFCAMDIGTFKACINRSGLNVASVQFDIIPKLNAFENLGSLFTYPNPSLSGSTFKIIYLFNYTYWGLPGGIIIDDDNDITNGYLQIAKNNIRLNGSIDILDTFNTRLLYITLFIYDNTTSQYIYPNYPHFIGSYGDARLWVQHDEYTILTGENSVQVFVMWINPYTKANVKIYVESVKTGKQVWLQDNPSYGGMQFYTAFDTGTYTMSLVLNDNIILDSDVFVVKYESELSPEQNYITSFLNTYGIIIGVVITVLFTLLPIIVTALLSRKTSISVINIPSLVYVGMFLLGVVISTTLNFFPIWVIFFVLFALILAFAILWIQRKIAE